MKYALIAAGMMFAAAAAADPDPAARPAAQCPDGWLPIVAVVLPAGVTTSDMQQMPRCVPPLPPELELEAAPLVDPDPAPETRD